MDRVKLAALKLNNPGPNAGVDYSTTEGPLVTFLNSYVYMILGGAAFIAIIYAGILFITSGGDSTKVQKAKNMLLYTIIGIMIITLIIAFINFASGEISNIISGS